MLVCVMQMRTLSERTQSIKTITINTRTHAHSCARRGVAVNLNDGTQATEDINRGERRGRLLPSQKSSSLALFPFNISSIQKVSLSLSSC